MIKTGRLDNFINSFQSDNGNFPSNSFIDKSYIKEFNNTQNKKVIKIL